MTNFYNPYSFVPFGDISEHKFIEAKKEKLKKENISHHRFTGLSGEIKCQITVKSPVFYGNQPLDIAKIFNKETKKKAEELNISVKAPYLRNGKQAIPASSIRGMLSSIGEIITHSPPRVLADSPMYYRDAKPRKNQAYGAIYKQGEQWYLKPLGIPASILQQQKNDLVIPKALRMVFIDKNKQPLPLAKLAAIRVSADKLIDQELSSCKLECKKDEKNKTKNTYSLSWQNEVFIEECAPHDCQYVACTKIAKDHPWVRETEIGSGYYRLLREGKVVNEQNNAKKAIYTYRIKKDNESNQESNGYAFFTENLIAAPMPINTELVELYLDIFNTSDRAKELLKKAGNNKQQEEQTEFDLDAINGEIVLFSVDYSGEICELRDSQIWRNKLKHTVFDFLPNKDIQPFNSQRGLSVMEQLFGTVADSKADQHDKNKVTAYASRIRVYDAISDVEITPNETSYFMLPLLMEPKPPCLAMYIHNKSVNNRCFIKKADLTPRSHSLNGSKRFVVRQKCELVEFLSKSLINEDNKNRTAAPTISKDTKLKFTIEFDNLTASELQLLAVMLEPALAVEGSEKFTHQIGLAKPYGYGNIHLSITSLTLEDKVTRYTQFESAKLTQWRLAQNNKDLLLEWIADLESAPCKNNTQLWNEGTLMWLQNLAKPRENIKYPSKDNKGYQWFVDNEKKQQQMLTCTKKGPVMLQQN
ncbi:TIGR03986 family type III CRISPR-associated RAMP protein [Pseudoalteromonas rhizosphaerae]|uniref:TIGR03986 family type III CRISPR-associated RAMP protein n=1 Tax=Pseudoalteromonas rhizosphaerae TaxID=2518973 RepID=UPI002148672D|nr:TIGR03986 family CRISPR-associated RAMP protein [Pseudoalteromonas rhizosphaerae]